MTIERVLGILGHAGTAGLGLGWVILKGVLLWGLVGIMVSLLIYLAVVRLGWLDQRGTRKRWARVTYGVILFVVFAPLAGGAGVVTQVRNKVSEILLTQLDETGATRGVGLFIAYPLLLARNIDPARKPPTSAPTKGATPTTPTKGATAKGVPAQKKRGIGARLGTLFARAVNRVAGSKKAAVPRGPDVSFLLKVKSQGVVKVVLGDAAMRIMRSAPVYQRLRRRSALGAFVGELALRYAMHRTEKKIAIYTQMFGKLEADDDGKLYLSQATRQIGRRFFRKAVLPTVEAPFNSLRLKLIIGALLALLLPLGVIRLVLARGGPKPASGEPLSSDGEAGSET